MTDPIDPITHCGGGWKPAPDAPTIETTTVEDDEQEEA
jgi:hypothetical protein